MHIEDQRCAAARCSADRLDQHAFDFLPVTRRVAEGALLAEVDFRQPAVVFGPAGEVAVLPYEQFGRVPGAVCLNRQRIAASFDAGEDQRAAVMLFGHGAIGIVDAQRALGALVDHGGEAAIGQPFGIDGCFGRARIESAVAARCHIDEVQRRVGRIVYVDTRDHRKLLAVGRDFDVAQLARRFDHAQHFAAGKVDHMRALGGVFIVDLGGWCAIDHGGLAARCDAEAADIAGDGHGHRLAIDFAAHLGGKQAVEACFLFVDDGIETGLGLLVARLVLFCRGKHPDARSVWAPCIGAHTCAIDCGQLALCTAVDRNAPHGAVFIAIGPHEGDHAAIGRESDTRNGHVVGQEVACVARRIGHLELLRRAAVFLAIGDVGKAGSRIGDAGAVGRHGDGADAFQLGHVFGRHRPRLRRGGKRYARKQSGGDGGGANGHLRSSPVGCALS